MNVNTLCSTSTMVATKQETITMDLRFNNGILEQKYWVWYPPDVGDVPVPTASKEEWRPVRSI